MYTRRNLLKDLSQAALLSTLGCQRSPPSRGEESIVTEFKLQKKLWGQKLRVLYPKGSLSNLKPIVSRFEAATHSQVELIESLLDEVGSELQILHSFGSESQVVDVALPPTFSIPDLVESDVIADLSAFAQRFEPESLKLDMLFPDGDQYKGKFYGYQADGDLYLLFLNRRKLKELAHQQGRQETDLIPKTWSELDLLMHQAHKPSENYSGGVLFRNRHYLHWEYWARLHSKGRLPFDQNMKAQLLSDESFETLESMERATQNLNSKSFKDDLFQNWERYSKLDSLANLGWGGTYKFLKKSVENIEDNFIVAPLPQINTLKGHSPFGYFNWGWNFVVTQKSQQKELAYLFCLFASLPEESTLAVRSIDGYFDPHHTSHYKDPVIQQLYGSNFIDVQKASFQSAIPDLYLQNSAAYYSALKQGLYSALFKITKPKAALSLINSKWDQITEQIGQDRQISQWQHLMSKYPKSIRELLK